MTSWMMRMMRVLAPRHPSASASPGVYLARLGLVVVAAVLATGCAARWAYHQGQEEAKRGNWDLAVARLTRAVQKDPDNIGYRIALENTRIQASRHHAELARRHLLAENLAAAVDELEIASKYDPANKSAADDLALVRARIEAREAERTRLSDFESVRRRAAARSPVPVLSPRSTSPIALRWDNQSLQKLFETLGKMAGVNVIFDEGFRDKNVSVNLTGITFQEALDQLTFTNRLFYKVLDQNTIIIVPESTAKRRQYDPLVLRTFYLQNAELKEIEAILKTALGTTARVLSTPALGAITILGTADQMALASNIVDRNDKPRGEVLVEVRIMEVNRTKLREYGIGLANYSAALDLAPFDEPGDGTSLNLRAHLISSLNLTDFVVTIPSRLLIGFLQSEANTKILASPRLRGAEGKKTSLSIGQEVPVPVTTFTSAQTGGGNTFAPATSFQYRNVGVNLELTPRVSAGGDITLEVAAEFSLLGASATVAGTELPTFSTRKVNGIVRMRDSETILMGGLIQDEEREAFAGALGVQSIPILNKLLGGPTSHDKQNTELLISLTPYLVRAPKITEEDLTAVAIGTQEIVRIPGAVAPLFGPEEPPAAPSPGAGVPPPPTGPTVGRPAGTVPPGMPAPEDVRTPASAPTPVPPVPTPLPPAVPEVIPTPIPQVVPTPAPEPSPSPAAPAPERPEGSVTGSATMEGRPAAPAARLSATFSPTEGSVGVGETATVGIVVLGAQDLSGVGVGVRYDPAMLEVVEVTPGYLLTVDGQAVAAERALETGLVRARFSRASGVAGSGIVVSITFRGLRPGVATVTAEGLSVTAGGGSQAVAVAPMRMTVD